jgi:inosine/xanthosine triphosphatase
MPKEVIIASKNPVKIEATRNGFKKMFPEIEFVFRGESVPSGVNDQPMTDEETFMGANSRVENVAKIVVDADYWVGIEGGLERLGEAEMGAFAWIVIKDKEGKIGKSKTGTFFLPKEVVSLIEQGKELGEADDIVFGQTNSKQKGGAVGNFTGNIITRTTFYSDAVVLALIPFKNPKLY